MATCEVSDPRRWRASSIDNRKLWYYPLDEPSLQSLDHALRAWKASSRPVTAIRSGEFPCSVCQPLIEQVREALERGRGFAVIDGLPHGRYSAEEQQAIYWLLGLMLAEPFAQNVEGTLLYDVRDTGRELSQGARFSVTNYESSFHTDNSFGDCVLDYVGLLCLQTAKSGGMSQVVSGYSVVEDLKRTSPHLLTTLCQPFQVDRRGGVRPGEEPTVPIPVISHRGDELLIRYLRFWIEAGHEKLRQPLTTAQQEALDHLDQVANQPDLRVEFMLRPGQMFFINNRWILHNRTAFVDFPEFERRRHYVRLWLKAR